MSRLRVLAILLATAAVYCAVVDAVYIGLDLLFNLPTWTVYVWIALFASLPAAYVTHDTGSN